LFPAGHTLQALALVNEAYLKLVDVRQMHWQNRAHFFGVAAGLMSRILADFRRRRYRTRQRKFQKFLPTRYCGIGDSPRCGFTGNSRKALRREPGTLAANRKPV
jgi:hypothetical protein